ncbi:CidA/LrgA family protein [Roseibium sp.]|uniref:CidA/LrgA family protein n=1 Tax=Roseibium sp. TaxID=1936156 RepID=UPI003A9691F5
MARFRQAAPSLEEAGLSILAPCRPRPLPYADRRFTLVQDEKGIGDAELMIFYLTLIFACQLAGELAKVALDLPVPGPVIGMVLLLAILIVRGSIPDNLAKVGDGFLSNLSLLFVPAGVGVMLHISLIGEQALAITLALVGSTLATIAVTALVMRALSRATLSEKSDG